MGCGVNTFDKMFLFEFFEYLYDAQKKAEDERTARMGATISD